MREVFTHNWFWIDEVLQRAGCFDFLDPLQYELEILHLCEIFLLGNSRLNSEIPLGQGIYRCISEDKYLGIVMPLEYKSQYPRHG